jgi:predicted nucleic-acid-binding Zn-ribbon protein
LDTKPCAKCGSADVVAGAVVWNAPLRFKAEGAGSFSRGKELRATACEACGYVELSLAR